MAAVLLAADAVHGVDPSELGERVHRLCAAGIHVGVVGPGRPALAPPPEGPGRLLEADTREALLEALEAEGVGPRLVLEVPSDPTDLPPDVLTLLDDRLRHLAAGRVPEPDPDPRWVLVERGLDPMRHRVTESLFTLATGGVATRGSVEEKLGEGRPMLIAAGVYAGETVDDGLLHGPTWTDVEIRPPAAQDVRTLDLRTGVLHRVEVDGAGRALRSLRFASARRPGVLALRLEARPGRLVEEDPPEVWRVHEGRAGGGIGMLSTDRWVSSCQGPDGTAGSTDGPDGSTEDAVEALERLAAVDAHRGRSPRRSVAGTRLRRAGALGFDRLLCEHRQAWARRWDAVDVRIPAAPADELGLRYALFQLWTLTGGRDELAVGARGLSGPAYSGHVFWDADVYVLPALMALDPDAAARMVDYRLHRLDAARRWAAAHGHTGARFPWESALTGDDVTPREGLLGGETVPILTGELEEHVTADVAWAVVRRAAWCGRTLRPAEEELLAETARYWASRCRPDSDGRVHLDRVMGPDEYHEVVDDNAFTNQMARWNLRRGADVPGDLVTGAERVRWRELADGLVDGYDPARGLHEQFAGYFELDPLTLAGVVTPPVAADLLLGRDRVARSQLIKQPDVLMLHHLLPDELPPGSRAADVAYYLPRTAHGSSLSTAITASVLARAGRTAEALLLLRFALGIDLEDRGGTTASGTHIGAAAGAWQAVLLGFLGADVRQGRLHLDPALPHEWPEVEVRFRCLRAEVRVRASGDEARVSASRPLWVAFGGDRPVRLPSGHREPLAGPVRRG